MTTQLGEYVSPKTSKEPGFKNVPAAREVKLWSAISSKPASKPSVTSVRIAAEFCPTRAWFIEEKATISLKEINSDDLLNKLSESEKKNKKKGENEK